MQKPYEYSYELRVGVASGSLMDLETTRRDPFGDEIITFGYIEGHTLRIVQRLMWQG